MNSVYFSGKLKKKYQAVDVQNAICAFSKEHGITVQCPNEAKTFVDFEIDSEGFCFSIENGSLTKQYVKHEVDEAGKFWLVYELLYQLHNMFAALHRFQPDTAWNHRCMDLLLHELLRETRQRISRKLF